MKRSDYAPMQAAPNPHADEARKALMDYGAQLLHSPPKVVEVVEDDMPPNDDQSLISAALTRTPDLSRYAALARIGVGMWRCEAHGIYCARAGMVVIEVKGVDAPCSNF